MISNAIANYMDNLGTTDDKLNFLTACQLETGDKHIFRYCEVLRQGLVDRENPQGRSNVLPHSLEREISGNDDQLSTCDEVHGVA